ncbi:MAG: hypothetical protein MJE77_37145 [Proteobacteria bacterium]|nr:hypothetical protein [Pseudomonadota bacterium]
MTRSALRAFLRRRVRWATMRNGRAVSVRPPKDVCAQLYTAPPASIQHLRLISPVPFVEPSGSIASEDWLDLRKHILYLGRNEDILPSALPDGEQSALDALLQSVAAFVLDETSQIHTLGLLVALMRCLPSKQTIPAFLIESAQSPILAHDAVKWLGQVVCTPNLAALYTVQETYRFGWRGTTPALFVTNAMHLCSLAPVTLAVELDRTRCVRSFAERCCRERVRPCPDGRRCLPGSSPARTPRHKLRSAAFATPVPRPSLKPSRERSQ